MQLLKYLNGMLEWQVLFDKSINTYITVHKHNTNLHSLTTAAPRCTIIFMGRAILLHPERMGPVLNEAIFICGNLVTKMPSVGRKPQCIIKIKELVTNKISSSFIKLE